MQTHPQLRKATKGLSCLNCLGISLASMLFFCTFIYFSSLHIKHILSITKEKVNTKVEQIFIVHHTTIAINTSI